MNDQIFEGKKGRLLGSKSVLGLSANEKTFLLITPTLAGALLGWALPGIAGWAGKLPFIPFQGILRWIGTFENNWIPIITAGLGALAGIAFALYVLNESLSITVSREEAVIFHKDMKIVLVKDDVKAVFPEGKDIVFADREGAELYRGQADVSRKSAALRRDLAKLGVMIHDEERRQYIRMNKAAG